MGFDLDEKYLNYVSSLRTDSRSSQEDAILKQIQKDLKEAKLPLIHISQEQGAFLQFLIYNFPIYKILELGTYWGYSSSLMAMALKKKNSSHSKIWVCDKNKDYLEKAKTYWNFYNLENLIQIENKDAGELLDSYNADPFYNQFFDLIFVDADKESYWKYYEKSLPLLKDSGMLIFDNALMKGEVYKLNSSSKAGLDIHQFNQKVFNDTKVFNFIVPVGDGFHWVMKKNQNTLI